MNVQVTVSTAGLKGFTTTVAVAPTDRIGDVAEKVSQSQLLGAFSEYSLLLGDEPLGNDRTVESCGLAAGSQLRFVLEADEKSVVSQLEEICVGRASSRDASLTVDELALLYCYKYGLSVNAALKTLGLEKTLMDLVEGHGKVFKLDGKRVATTKAVAEQPAAQPLVQPAPAEKVQPAAKPKKKRPASPSRPAALVIDEASFQALHTTISGRSFHSKAMQDLRTLEQVLTEQCFLQVKEVVRGGSVGRGTACLGVDDAELVFVVDGLPPSKHELWLPRLYKAFAAALAQGADRTAEPVAEDTCVRLGPVTVRVAPHFDSYASAVQSLGLEPPEARPYFDASFTKERVSFIGKQPGSVKAVMRMLKWWREQQTWSCALTTPTNELLELVAVYVSQQCGKVGLGQQVSNCFSLLGNLSQVRVIWSQFYSPQDIWAPLMAQRPLLMDPVNPFRNVLDPKDFDPREVSEKARTTTFW